MFHPCPSSRGKYLTKFGITRWRIKWDIFVLLSTSDFLLRRFSHCSSASTILIVSIFPLRCCGVMRCCWGMAGSSHAVFTMVVWSAHIIRKRLPTSSDACVFVTSSTLFRWEGRFRPRSLCRACWVAKRRWQLFRIVLAFFRLKPLPRHWIMYFTIPELIACIVSGGVRW